MAKIIVQTDEGREVSRYDFPASSSYALTYMPSCPTNRRIHGLLLALKRDIDEAIWIEQTGHPRPARPSELVMRIIALQRDNPEQSTD